MTSPDPSSSSLQEARAADGLLEWLSVATVLAAGVELVILRVFTRTAIHIPGFADLRSVYVPISEAGRSAFYVAVVLLMVTLVLIVDHLYRRGAVVARAGAAGVALFLIVAAIARIGGVDGMTLDGATLLALLLLAPWALGGAHGRSRFPTIVLVMAFVFSALIGTEQALAGSGRMFGGGSWLALAGEVLAVGAAVATPLLVGRVRSRPALAWGAAVGGSIYAGLLVNASTVKILLLWNFGLAGYLPSILYGIAAGAVTYTIVAMRASGRRTSAVGMALLFMGGIGLHSTYQTGLVLAGLMLLGVGDRPIGSPSTDAITVGAG
ncbi:MAG: hypothetical protein ACXWDU_01910 [Actinomycetota bacterium]